MESKELTVEDYEKMGIKKYDPKREYKVGDIVILNGIAQSILSINNDWFEPLPCPHCGRL